MEGPDVKCAAESQYAGVRIPVHPQKYVPDRKAEGR
jgi:hypothetical protein